MINSRTIYAELASKEKFQDIPDSPTVKYYTNWREFEKRLTAPEATRFIEAPEWALGLTEKRLILTDEIFSTGIREDWINIYEDYDIIKDIGVIGKMEYLHAARAKVIAELRIPPGVDAGKILILSSAGEGYVGHHLKIVLEPGSKAEILLIDLGYSSHESLKTLTISYDIRDSAHLQQYIYVNHNSSAVYSRRVYRLGFNGLLDLKTLYVSGAATRINEDVFLDGRGSITKVFSSAIATKQSWGDVLLNARHRGPNSKTLIKGRGVVLDSANLSLRGIAIVEEDAEWSSSHVEVHVSTLGENARGNASPMLEIHTGNVEEAFHSASVSSLNEDELFYLKSRGLNDEEARELLIEGVIHYSNVIDYLNIPIKDVLNRDVTR